MVESRRSQLLRHRRLKIAIRNLREGLAETARSELALSLGDRRPKSQPVAAAIRVGGSRAAWSDEKGALRVNIPHLMH